MPQDFSAIVFGKGPVAIHAATMLRGLGARIPLVVPATVELNDQPSFEAWAHESGLPTAAPGDLDAIADIEADLGLSVFFDRLFRPGHIARFGRLVNVHNSLLPRHRGVRPINWALKDGDLEHGVTVHEITPGIDDGPVIAQRTFPIDPERDEVADVYPRALAAAIALLDETLPEILTRPAMPQDASLASTHLSRDDALLGDRRYWRRGDVSFTG